MVRFDSIRFDSIRFDSIRFDSMRAASRKYRKLYFLPSTLCPQESLSLVRLVTPTIESWILEQWKQHQHATSDFLMWFTTTDARSTISSAQRTLIENSEQPMALTHTVLHRILTVVLFHVLQSSLQDKRVGDVLDEVDDGVVVQQCCMLYHTVVPSTSERSKFSPSLLKPHPLTLWKRPRLFQIQHHVQLMWNENLSTRTLCNLQKASITDPDHLSQITVWYYILLCRRQQLAAGCREDQVKVPDVQLLT